MVEEKYFSLRTLIKRLGNSCTPFGKVRESNHGSGVCKEDCAKYYVPKSSILLAGTGIWKVSFEACGFRSIKIDYSDYQKMLISRINEVFLLFFFQ